MSGGMDCESDGIDMERELQVKVLKWVDSFKDN